MQITGPGRRPGAVVTLLLGLACGLVFAVGGNLMLAAAPAFAGPPDKPANGKASAVTATTATLEGGVLNPKAKGEAGESEYWFRVSETECEGESATPPEAAVGNEKEAIPPVALTNLQPNAHYTFCLIEHNLAGEYSLPSTPEHFITQAAKPTFDSESGFSSTQTEATLETRINPNNQATTCKFEYGTNEALSGAASALCEPATLEGFPAQRATANLAGLTPNTAYYYRVVAENGAGKMEEVPINTFTTVPLPPLAQTEGAAAITQTTATISGYVNGQGADTHYLFNWGETETYGKRIPTEEEDRAGKDGGVITEPTRESVALTGLTPNTAYHYQVVAYNSGACSISCPPVGNNTKSGADVAFTTLALAPVALADPPLKIESTSAILSGSVNPQGVAATYRFEYGTTTGYGTSVPEEAVAATKSGLGVSANIAGLAPNTTYHYRLVAANNGGATVADSPDEAFTTYAAGTPSTAPPPLGFSLTGTASAGPAAAIFANLTGFAPMSPPAAKPTNPPKPLTNAQKLAKALKACKKDKSKSKRTTCEKHARQRYSTSAKKKDTKKK